jgi:hypothetical protein
LKENRRKLREKERDNLDEIVHEIVELDCEKNA